MTAQTLPLPREEWLQLEARLEVAVIEHDQTLVDAWVALVDAWVAHLRSPR